jgi:hypothetical protein
MEFSQEKKDQVKFFLFYVHFAVLWIRIIFDQIGILT